MNNPFRRFFEGDEEKAVATSLDNAHEVLAFAGTAYFEKFMAYLEAEGDRPLDTADPTAMIKSAARINAFKEIRTYLRRKAKAAVEVIERENDNG